jgi:hypothetical protein
MGCLAAGQAALCHPSAITPAEATGEHQVSLCVPFPCAAQTTPDNRLATALSDPPAG